MKDYLLSALIHFHMPSASLVQCTFGDFFEDQVENNSRHYWYSLQAS